VAGDAVDGAGKIERCGIAGMHAVPGGDQQAGDSAAAGARVPVTRIATSSHQSLPAAATQRRLDEQVPGGASRTAGRNRRPASLPIERSKAVQPRP